MPAPRPQHQLRVVDPLQSRRTGFGAPTRLARVGSRSTWETDESEVFAFGKSFGFDRTIGTNHQETTSPPAIAVAVMRAEVAFIEQATEDRLAGRGGTREETLELIVASILATVREVVPAAVAVEAGSAPHG